MTLEYKQPLVEKKLNVAVIGAGVSGLAAAKCFQAEGFQVTVYERQKKPGGVWVYTEDATEANASAVYNDLYTNFPRHLMEFSDFPWDDNIPGAEVFPSHEVVQEYLGRYTDEFNLQIEYGTEVVDLHGATRIWPYRWRLQTKATGDSKPRPNHKFFDRVVVAIGNFDKPFMPAYEGLAKWQAAAPESISHAKAFRDKKDFRAKRVLVIGYGASGFDITSKLTAKGGAHRVWVSSRLWRPNMVVPAGVQKVGAVKRLSSNVKSRRVYFDDGGVIQNVDHIIFCTGYVHTHPFLRAGKLAGKPLFPDGQELDHIWEHMFYYKDPSLAFVGLSKAGAPTFLVSQAQAAYISRVWADRAALPFRRIMEAEAGARHEMPDPQFIKYLKDIEGWCVKADQKNPPPPGNLPFNWSLALDWISEYRREIRQAFEEKKKLGQKCNSLWSLGFQPPAPGILTKEAYRRVLKRKSGVDANTVVAIQAHDIDSADTCMKMRTYCSIHADSN